MVWNIGWTSENVEDLFTIFKIVIIKQDTSGKEGNAYQL
jgi:hypothetical protein